MAQGKQAKVLTNAQVQAMLRHLEAGRNADRNKVIFLLTMKAVSVPDEYSPRVPIENSPV